MIGGVQFGTTSACAENTVESLGRSKNHRNYLRVRGEYNNAIRKGISGPELPPRARRILQEFQKPTGVQGTTSACAENTGRPPKMGVRGGNYLRVRGEYP